MLLAGDHHGHEPGAQLLHGVLNELVIVEDLPARTLLSVVRYEDVARDLDQVGREFGVFSKSVNPPYAPLEHLLREVVEVSRRDLVAEES